jgi:glycosyltransferase involved in cell wall biosynthesis
MKPARKILYLVEDFNVGGLERAVEVLYDGLDRTRFSPRVWCLAAGGFLAEKFLQQKKKIRIFNFKNYHNPVCVLQLAGLIRRGRFAVVHTHGYFAGTLGRAAALLAGTPVVVSHVHTVHRDLKARNRCVEWLFSLFTDRIICCSNAALRFMQEKVSVRPQKMVRIYNGALCREEEVAKESAHKAVRICLVASLNENKGHRVLMKAMASVRMRHPTLVLTFVGDGPLRAELGSYAGDLGIAALTEFLGFREDVQTVLSRSDIAVLPSLFREGLGTFLLEAMCHGLPLVGSNIGGIPEVVQHGVNGYLVAPGSVPELRHAIELLISEPELRRQMGARSRRIFEKKFSARRMVGQVEVLYEGLLNG